MAIDENKLKELLLDQWGYKLSQVERTILKINAMDTQLINAFDDFLSKGVFLDEPSFFGLNPKTIAENYPFKPPAVFLCLDWIKRDPLNAMDVLVEEYKKPLPQSFDPIQLRDYLQKIPAS